MEKIVIAPHADDEIIGCFEVLETRTVSKVYFGDSIGVHESYTSSQVFGYERHEFCDFIPEKGVLYLFPDPTTEHHPLHKKLGGVGVSLLQDGYDVIFYTTNMNTPYLREVLDPVKKKIMLNKCYTGKMDLWKYDHKYFLFEGHSKWIQKWED